MTLALATILHAFTHAYGMMLVPLYLLIRDDLQLTLIGSVSLITTLYGLIYSLGSYAGGVLADRFNRKVLLGVGLLGNGLAITAMGLTRQYELLIVLAILGGAFGTLFHPAANALVPAHYPKSPGMAIGMLGIGSGLGFFIGPQFAGWRAQSAQWEWGQIANWQKPCVEFGLLGVLTAIVFLIIASEAHRSNPAKSVKPHPTMAPRMRWKVAQMALTLAWRDFAGVASLTLLSLYLQKVFGYDAKRAGFNIGAMMLLGMIVNPVAVLLSPGRKRLRALCLILFIAAGLIAIVPFFERVWIFPLMFIFQGFQLGSYAVSDAAMLERVAPEIRGRVVGLFLTLAGTVAAMAPFVVGYWVDLLGDRADEQSAYIPIFVSLAAMFAFSTLSVRFFRQLGPVQGPPIEPITETMPRTVEVLG